MGNDLSDLITVLVNIVFYALSLLSILGALYSYLKQWDLTKRTVENIELRLMNPLAIILVKVINYSRFLVVPIIIWGLTWAALYAELKLRT